MILDKKWNTPSRPLFKELNCLPFDKIMEFLRNIVLKALNNLAPNYIWAMFTMSSDIHNAGTRNKNHNLILPKVRLVWPKMLSGFQQLGAGTNSQKTSKRPSLSVHFRWNLKRTFHDHKNYIWRARRVYSSYDTKAESNNNYWERALSKTNIIFWLISMEVSMF